MPQLAERVRYCGDFPRMTIRTDTERIYALICELFGRFHRSAFGLSREYLKRVTPYIAALNDENLMAVIRTLVELRHEEDDEWRPNEIATGRAIDIIADMCTDNQLGFPRCAVAPNGDGGVRLTWRRQGIEVRLVVPGTADLQPYIYKQTATTRLVIERITGQTLSNVLGSLTR
jgi:hypothetical protein